MITSLQIWLNHEYPVTICKSRYQGGYEGGKWVAFALYAEALPYEWDGGDIECAEFWGSSEANFIGRGNTSKEAFDDLVRRIKEATSEDPRD